jgi:hypothetical protein
VANTLTNVLPSLLAQGVLALRQNAVMPRLVNRSYESLAAQEGNVVNIPIPSAIAQRAVTPSITMNSNVDSSPTAAVVTLDYWYEAPFQLSDSDFVSASSRLIPMQASEAVKALANGVDSYMLGKHTGIFGLAGTAGTTPFGGSLNMAANADMKLNRQLAPIDDRRAVINPQARENLILNTQVLQADQRGDTDGIIKGVIGTKLGFDWYMNQNIGSYTPGTGWASGNIASTVAGAVGDTTLNIINATASGQIKVGDIFSFVADTSSHQYVVTVTNTISATVQVAITFYPGLKTTVATGATLLVVSVPYTVNLAFHRDAFAWASRPLTNVSAAGNVFQAPTDPVSGLALRLELSRQYKQDTFSYDILGGGNLIRKELAVKIAGA